eukprot:s1692_g9.t1
MGPYGPEGFPSTLVAKKKAVFFWEYPLVSRSHLTFTGSDLQGFPSSSAPTFRAWNPVTYLAYEVFPDLMEVEQCVNPLLASITARVRGLGMFA